jgi:hypothetical protein
MKRIIEQSNIEEMIYEIRGKQVMLDSDLAILYGVETKRINEAVKNNPKKFPERFSWILDDSEHELLRSKISTLKKGRGQHSKYKPRVFTEQGIAMLSTILKRPIAVNTSIRIMDAFVSMRRYIANSIAINNEAQKMLIRHDTEIKLLQELFEKLEKKEILKSLLNYMN